MKSSLETSFYDIMTQASEDEPNMLYVDGVPEWQSYLSTVLLFPTLNSGADCTPGGVLMTGEQLDAHRQLLES